MLRAAPPRPILPAESESRAGLAGRTNGHAGHGLPDRLAVCQRIFRPVACKPLAGVGRLIDALGRGRSAVCWFDNTHEDVFAKMTRPFTAIQDILIDA
jgi:hypothetical protein